MIAQGSSSQPSGGLGGVGPFAATGWAGVPMRMAVALALACVALGAMVHQDLSGSASRPIASGTGSHAISREGLLSLPLLAQAQVSAALGRDEAAYRIHGLMARNLAQRFSARFGRSGVAVTAGPARFAIALKGVRAPELAAAARGGFASGEC
jgi:hypothetical protein